MDNFFDILSDKQKSIVSEMTSKYDDNLLQSIEDNIFKNYSEMKKIDIEVRRINKALEANTGLMYKYYDYINDIKKDIEVVPLAEKVYSPKVKTKIVALDIAIGLPIGLYTAIPLLNEEIQKESLYGK